MHKSTLFIFPWLEKEKFKLEEVPLAMSGSFIPSSESIPLSDGTTYYDEDHNKLVVGTYLWDERTCGLIKI